MVFLLYLISLIVVKESTLMHLRPAVGVILGGTILSNNPVLVLPVGTTTRTTAAIIKAEITATAEVKMDQIMDKTEETIVTTKPQHLQLCNVTSVVNRDIVAPSALKSNLKPVFFPVDSKDLPEGFDPFGLDLNDLPVPSNHEDLTHFNFLNCIQGQLNSAGYEIASNLHSEQSIIFHERVLKAPKLVLDVLRHGYIPELNKDLDLPYAERNNASALAELPFVRKDF